ncbi:MAG TPA: hypothetical protein VGN16_10490 [Acidobacteriaceae bacterium]
MALLLGVAGAVAGGFVSYLQLQTISAEKTGHAKFEALASSNAVEQLRKSQAGWHTIDPKTGERTEWDQQVGKDGIESIHWTRDSAIGFIVVDDGHFLFPTPAPSAREYLLVVLFPVVGFFIPWGIIRAIGWVGSGFFQPLK